MPQLLQLQQQLQQLIAGMIAGSGDALSGADSQQAQVAEQNAQEAVQSQPGSFESALAVRKDNLLKANKAAAILAGRSYVKNRSDRLSGRDMAREAIINARQYSGTHGVVEHPLLSKFKNYPTGPISGSPPPEDSPPEMSVDDRFAALPERWDVGNILPGYGTLVTEGDAPNRRRLIGAKGRMSAESMGVFPKTAEEIGKFSFDELLRKVGRSSMAPMGSERAKDLIARRKVNELLRAANPKFDPANPTTKQRNIAARAARRGKPGLLESIERAAEELAMKKVGSEDVTPYLKSTYAIEARYKSPLRKAATPEIYKKLLEDKTAELLAARNYALASAQIKSKEKIAAGREESAAVTESRLLTTAQGIERHRNYSLAAKPTSDYLASLLDNPGLNLVKIRKAREELTRLQVDHGIISPPGDGGEIVDGNDENPFATQHVFPEGMNTVYKTPGAVDVAMTDFGYLNSIGGFTTAAKNAPELIEMYFEYMKIFNPSQMKEYEDSKGYTVVDGKRMLQRSSEARSDPIGAKEYEDSNGYRMVDGKKMLQLNKPHSSSWPTDPIRVVDGKKMLQLNRPKPLLIEKILNY